MAFTKEIVDFSGLDDQEIQKTLASLNISLTSDEVKKFKIKCWAELPLFPN